LPAWTMTSQKLPTWWPQPPWPPDLEGNQGASHIRYSPPGGNLMVVCRCDEATSLDGGCRGACDGPCQCSGCFKHHAVGRRGVGKCCESLFVDWHVRAGAQPGIAWEMLPISVDPPMMLAEPDVSLPNRYIACVQCAAKSMSCVSGSYKGSVASVISFVPVARAAPSKQRRTRWSRASYSVRVNARHSNSTTARSGMMLMASPA
jgi:hypothetical protein